MSVDVVPLGAAGAEPAIGLDPNGQGGAVDPNAILTPPTSESAATTPATPSSAGGAHGSSAPESSVPNEVEEDWKAKLPANVRADVDRVITSLRQKDAEKIRGMEMQLAQGQWAVELNRLLGSPDPSEKAQGRELLLNTLRLVEGQTAPPPPEPDLFAQVDWTAAESYIPGISALMQSLKTQNDALRAQLGETSSLAEGTARAAAKQRFDQELAAIQKWATDHGLPFDAQVVVNEENQHKFADLKKAYFAAYGEQLVEAGKQAAFRSLKTKQQAALPGASPAAVVATAPPKVGSMAEALAYARQQHGYTGPINR